VECRPLQIQTTLWKTGHAEGRPLSGKGG
jgi:hypothetical protein